MPPAARYYLLAMTLVGAIAAVAALWVHLSHLKRYQGAMLAHLWSTHGLHVLDLLALGLELLLLLALSVTLLAGFTHRR